MTNDQVPLTVFPSRPSTARTTGQRTVIHTRNPTSSSMELERYISFLPVLAFGINLQAAWQSAAVSFQQGLQNGGPTSLVWGTLITWIGSLAMAASLAELASIHSSAGAQYRWASMFSPPGIMSKAFWGLVQGWISVFAWIATCAQPAFFMGTAIQGLVALNDPNYVAQRWHGTLIAWAFFAVPVLVCIFARRMLSTVQVLGVIANISSFIIIVVTLVVLSSRSSASFVFGQNIFGVSGWESDMVQWCLGLTVSAFPTAAFDGMLHLSDEVKDPSRTIPRAMILTVLVSGGMALSFTIVVLFCLGDFALATAAPYPIINIVANATHSPTVATIILSLLIFNGLVSTFSSLTSVSRLVWAFAQDGGLPFSELLKIVHPRFRIPLNTLGLVSVVIMAIEALNVASTTALSAIVSISLIGLYLTYVIPIMFIALAKLRGDDIKFGPFKMGQYGVFVNIASVVYGIFIIAWLPLPAMLPVTADNMNYAGPIIAVVVSFALGDWFVSGKRRFASAPHKWLASYQNRP